MTVISAADVEKANGLLVIATNDVITRDQRSHG